jgi:hypothetical protein
MTDTTVTTEVHQTFDIHRDIATKIALNLKTCNRGTKLRNFWLSEIFHWRRRIDFRRRADLLRARVTNTVDRRQCNHDVLIQRYIYACYTCHSNSSFRAKPCFRSPFRLSLALFVPRVSADHSHDTFATNDLAVSADFFN